jgi:hypothetical protein
MPFVKLSQLKNPFPRANPKSRFTAEQIRATLQSLRRNPSVSGSMPSDARLIDSAGSDSGRKYKLTGSVQARGMVYVKTSNQTVMREPCNETCKQHRHDGSTRK